MRTAISQLQNLGALGSFIGGLAAAAGLFGVYLLWQQWKDQKSKDRNESLRLEEDRAHRENLALARESYAAMEQTVTRLLNLRGTYLQNLVSSQMTEFLKRSVNLNSMIRNTTIAIESITDWFELLATLPRTQHKPALHASYTNILKTVAKEDIKLVDHFADFDFRVAKHFEEKNSTIDLSSFTKDQLLEHEFAALSRAYESSTMFMSTAAEVDRLKAAVKRLKAALEPLKASLSEPSPQQTDLHGAVTDETGDPPTGTEVGAAKSLA